MSDEPPPVRYPDFYYEQQEACYRPKIKKIDTSVVQSMSEDEVLRYVGFDLELKKSNDRQGVAYSNHLWQLRQKPVRKISENGILNRIGIVNWKQEFVPEYDPKKEVEIQQQVAPLDAKLAELNKSRDYDKYEKIEELENKIGEIRGPYGFLENYIHTTVQYPLPPPMPPLPPKTTPISKLPKTFQRLTYCVFDDRDGRTYFEMLNKYYKPILGQDAFLSKQYQKPVQMQEIIRPGFSTGTQFNISSGAAWSYFDKSLGPAGEYQPIVPVLPEVILRKKKQLSKTFLYAQYVSFLKLNALAEDQSFNSPEITAADGKYQEVFEETVVGSGLAKQAEDFKFIEAYKFTDDLVPEAKMKKYLEKRCVQYRNKEMLPAFYEAHNKKMLQFMEIVDKKPRYPKWDQTNYRIRLTIDILLKHALQLRMKLEEKVETLRQLARLKALGIKRQQPIFEQIPERLSTFEQEMQLTIRQRFERYTANYAAMMAIFRKLKSTGLEERRAQLLAEKKKVREPGEHVRKKMKFIDDNVQHNHAQSRDYNNGYQRRRWIFDFGEVELDRIQTLEGVGMASKPYWPTSPRSIKMINPKAAIQWAFSVSDDPTIARRFSFPASDSCAIDIDFEKMNISIVCIREGVKLEETMALDPVFSTEAAELERSSKSQKEVTGSPTKKSNNAADSEKKSTKKGAKGTAAKSKDSANSNATSIGNAAIRFNRLDDAHLELKLVNDADYTRLFKEKEYLSSLLRTLNLPTPASPQQIKSAIAEAQQLLPKVTKINNVNGNGFNTLHLITLHNLEPLVTHILDLFNENTVSKGSQSLDLNCRNNDGNTALHLAVLNLANSGGGTTAGANSDGSKRYQLVNTLLTAGIDTSIKNHDNNMAFDLFTNREDRTNFFVKQTFTLAALQSNSYALWFHILQLQDIDETPVGQCVMDYVVRYPALATAKDIQGRVAVDMATPYNRTIINSVFLWHGRYRVIESRPEHQSATCYVYRALDEDDKDDTGNARQVALKLIRLKAHFQREIMVRRHEFNPDYVVDIIARFPQYDRDLPSWPEDVSDLVTQARNNQMKGNDDALSESTGVSTKAEAEQFFCLVMPYASRNMFVALKQERFAGRNMEEVRHIFTQLMHCVAHLHERGVLHADLKSLNMVRMETQWKLIDMDASCIIGKETVGYKTSSAYLPPEAIFVDKTKSVVKVRSCAPQFVHESAEVRGYELLMADPSFDVWSLGCILYQMCNADVRPLFQGGQDDNLSLDPSEDDNLFLLAEWSTALKARKLQRVVDPLARNLLSQMLQKDPRRRPTIMRILAHPFISNKHVARMFGEKPDFDVFISYRVASDADHAELMYNLLTAKGLKVWWDKKCLKPGVEWKEGFCAGLVNSRTFVCLISPDAIFHPTNNWQNFSKLREDSHCDNVLLEHRLALELKRFLFIEDILPVYIGRKGPTNGSNVMYNRFLDEVNLTHELQSALPECSVRLIEADLNLHLDSQALGKPNEPGKSVRAVVEEITAHDGVSVEGERNVAFDGVVDRVLSMLNTLDLKEKEAAGTSGNGSGLYKDTLRSELSDAEATLRQLQQTMESKAAKGSQQQPAMMSPRSKSAGVLGLHSALVTAKQIEMKSLLSELSAIEEQLRSLEEENASLKGKVQP